MKLFLFAFASVLFFACNHAPGDLNPSVHALFPFHVTVDKRAPATAVIHWTESTNTTGTGTGK